MMAEERTIKHVRYLPDGTEEYFDVIVPPDNYDDKNVWITRDLLRQIAKTGHKGDTGSANYAGQDRKYWYRGGDGIGDIEILAMNTVHKGTTYEFEFKLPSGGFHTVILPVE